MSSDRRCDGTDFPCPSSVHGSRTGEDPGSLVHARIYIGRTTWRIHRCSSFIRRAGRGRKRERERKRESEVNRVVVANSSAVVDERRGRRTTRSSDVSGSSANAGVGGGGGGGEGWAKVRRQGRADARAGERASGRRASGVGARRGGWLKEGMTPRTTGVNRCTMLPVSHSHGSSSLALILRTRRAREGPAKCA